MVFACYSRSQHASTKASCLDGLVLPTTVHSHEPLYACCKSELRASFDISHTNVGSLNGGLWCPESQSNVLVPSSSTFSDSAGLCLDLLVKENVRLLLESAFALDSEFGGHDCDGGCRSRCGLVFSLSWSAIFTKRFLGRSLDLSASCDSVHLGLAGWSG